MKKWLKKSLNIIVLILITALVLYFSLKDNFKTTVTEIFSMNVWWTIIAFLFIFFYWIFRSYALFLIVRENSKKFKFAQSFQLMLRTQFFNAVTPFATGGQPFQIYYLNQCDISIGSATGLVVENFIVYQIALVLLGIIAVVSNYFLHIFSKVHILQKLVTLGFIINTLVIVIMFIVAFGKKISKKILNFSVNMLVKLRVIKDKEKKLNQWDKSINQFHGSATILLKNKPLFLKTVVLNFVALLCLYLIPIFIFYAIGLYTQVTGFEVIIASSYVMLMGSFVPIPGGTGGLEYGFMAFYGSFIKGGTLSAIMLVWRFITYYFGLIIGSIAVNMKRVK